MNSLLKMETITPEAPPAEPLPDVAPPLPDSEPALPDLPEETEPLEPAPETPSPEPEAPAEDAPESEPDYENPTLFPGKPDEEIVFDSPELQPLCPMTPGDHWTETCKLPDWRIFA